MTHKQKIFYIFMNRLITKEEAPFVWAWVFSELFTLFSTRHCHLYYQGKKYSLAPDFAHFSLKEEGVFFPLFHTPFSLQSITMTPQKIICGEWEFEPVTPYYFHTLHAVKQTSLPLIDDGLIVDALSQLQAYIQSVFFKLNTAYRVTGDTLQALYELELDEVIALSKNFYRCFKIKGVASITLKRAKKPIEIEVFEEVVSSNATQARIACEILLEPLGTFHYWISYRATSVPVKRSL